MYFCCVYKVFCSRYKYYVYGCLKWVILYMCELMYNVLMDMGINV